jgi:phage terminase large subunit-like protein
MAKSLAEEIAALTPEEQAEIFKNYSEADYEKLNYDANFWLRPEQKIPDGDWFITALVAGRGFGKTLTASQWIRRKALENPGCRIAIAARTVADVRNTMILGESGVLAVHAPEERPEYKPSTTSLLWPNGGES